MRILGAAPSDPDSVAQYFKTGLPIEAGETYFARVRAVDEPTTGDYPATPVYSMWSNERREAYEPPGSYLFFTPTDPTPGTGSSLAPVIPRDADLAGTDVPVLRWRPLPGADAYRVVIALDRDFTDRVATYWTRNTVFVPPEVYDDNGPNGKYHWFAGPCWYTSVEEQEVECLAAEDYAINDPRYVGRFSKKSAPIADLQHSAIDDGTNVLLRWADALTAAKAKPSAQTPGGVSAYEVQMSDGDWKNAVSITTDNLAYSTSLKTLAPATYQWRVRPLDGQKVPLAWSYGAPFTIVRGPLYTPPRPTKRSPKLIPGRPGKPRVRAVTRRKLRVAWRHSEAFGAAVRTYKVYRSVNAGPYRRVAATSKAKLRLRAKRGKVYRFYIVADSNAGPGKRSATTRFRMPWRA
jgi:hypothetical protein